jgi:hypothetical protein
MNVAFFNELNGNKESTSPMQLKTIDTYTLAGTSLT